MEDFADIQVMKPYVIHTFYMCNQKESREKEDES